MDDVIESIKDYLDEKFDGYEIAGAEPKQQPTPGYRFYLRSTNGRGHNIHFSNHFLQNHTPEEAILTLEIMGLEVAAEEFAEEDVVVLINSGGISVQDL